MENNLPIPDDLQEKLEKFLSSPDSMAKISGLLGSLGQGEAAAPSVAPPSPPSTSSMPDLTKLMPLLAGMSGDSDDTRLLRALRPYLRGERADRLDGALKMMQLSQVLPLVSGLKKDLDVAPELKNASSELNKSVNGVKDELQKAEKVIKKAAMKK